MHGRINTVISAVLCLTALGCQSTYQAGDPQSDGRIIADALAVPPGQHEQAIAELYDALRTTRRAIQVTSHNIARAETIGYKAQRIRSTGVNGSSVTVSDFATGSPKRTGMDYDMMIDGEGFFRVAVPGDAHAYAYTRAGNFFRNVDGDLVLGNSHGPTLDPPINIPEGVTNICITQEGTVCGITTGSITMTEFGRIELAHFDEPRALQQLSDALYVQTADSSPPILDYAGNSNLGTIMHKFVESSNVDPETELAELTRLNWRHDDLHKAINILTDRRASQ